MSRLLCVLTMFFVWSCSNSDDLHWREQIELEMEHKTESGDSKKGEPAESVEADPVVRGVPVPPAPFSPGIFPCSNCHAAMDPNPERRDLYFHTEIVLDHGPRERWCFDCHNPDDRDKLRLVSGTLIGFDESYRLCGQCHGPKLRDWKAGVHGKRTGYWNGEKQYRLCVHCHVPHSPRFKPLQPKPRPLRPDEIQ